jgi:hypothetical protein
MLWAVAFRSKSNETNQPFLVGESWHAVRSAAYADEPMRALLFRTRRAAREWAKEKTLDSKRHSVGWKLWPVRVRETLCPNVSDQPRGPKKDNL